MSAWIKSYVGFQPCRLFVPPIVPPLGLNTKYPVKSVKLFGKQGDHIVKRYNLGEIGASEIWLTSEVGFKPIYIFKA